jgi:hypothetical protein
VGGPRRTARWQRAKKGGCRLDRSEWKKVAQLTRHCLRSGFGLPMLLVEGRSAVRVRGMGVPGWERQAHIVIGGVDKLDVGREWPSDV